jgi:hypothetical protein
MTDDKDKDKGDNVIHGKFGDDSKTPPTPSPTPKLKKYLIGPLTFGGKDGYVYRFEPRQDMTPYEASRIFQLFIVSLIHPKVNLDRQEFLARYALHRHFVYEPESN